MSRLDRRSLLAAGAAAALPLKALAQAVPSPDPDAPNAPAAKISNGLVSAVLLLPDVEKGYYRGTRFDWSGNIASLEAGGHSYFGRWYPTYDPKRHDAIMGPVHDFVSGQGFLAAPVGGSFVKLGVGVLRKPADPIRGFPTLEIIDPGQWTTRVRKDAVDFIHEVNDPASGYGYRYAKTVALTPGKPQLVLTHRLESTGQNPIDTEMYDHNFFVFDGQPAGPDIEVRFPFDIKAFEIRGDAAQVQGKKIVYLKPPSPQVRMQIKGFSDQASDYDIHVEHKRTGAGVRVTSDTPLSDVVFWSNPRTTCPEAYTHIHAERGKPMAWTITYDFYSLPKVT